MTIFCSNVETEWLGSGKHGGRVHVTRTHIVYYTQTLLLRPKTEGRDRGGMEMQKGSKVEKERAGQFLPHVKWMDNTLHRLPHSRSGKTAVNTERKFRQWLSYDGLDGMDDRVTARARL